MSNCVFLSLTFQRVACLAVLLIFGLQSNALASGFAVNTQGASALAQANAVTAHLDDPAAIFFNPALIGKLTGTRMQVGTTLIHGSRTFESDHTGSTSDGKKSVNFPSTLYVTHQFTPKLTAGFGVYSPFGLGSRWDENWEGRYVTTRSDLTTFNLNPVLCWQVVPGLSVAGGVDVLLLDATLEKRLNLSPLSDGNQKFHGDGNGVGFNIGVLLDLGDQFSLGVHYRSEIEVDVDGNANFSLPPGTPQVIRTMLRDSGGKTQITLPRQIQAGLAFMGIDKLVVEAGVRWEDWSSFKRLKIDLDSGRSTTTERDWGDVIGFNVGGRYQLKDGIAIMAGYLYDGTPAPDSTFDPSIPTAKSHLFSTGVDLEWQRYRVQLAYAFQKYENRTKSNAVGAAEGGVANGNYRTENHMFALSLICRLF